MIETNKYELTINLKDLENVVSQDGQRPTTKEDQSDKILKSWKTFALTQIVQPFINTALNINSIELSLSGRQQQQERWELQKKLITSPVATAGFLAGGAALGAALGIGGVAGAAVAAVVAVVYAGLTYVTESARIGVAKEKENAQIRQTQSRAGWAFNKSRGGQ